MSPVPARDAPITFHIFGSDHLAVLALSTLLAVVMIWIARRGDRPRLVRVQEIALGIFLLAKFPAGLAIGWWTGLLDKESFLPMHLCDLAAIAGGIALLTRHPLCAELTYFWGMAGTLNGLITPTVLDAFPHPAFFVFFWLHAGVVLAATYLVFGARLWPRPGALPRAIVWTLGYMAAAALVNLFLGTNYGFLCAPPPTRSLVDALGPWPWYLIGFIVLGIVCFSLLYLPFYLIRKFGRRNA
jgi:hypothetical integral membrane protein (TIGR02206 family)